MSLYKEMSQIVLLSLFVSITSTFIASITGIVAAIPFSLKDFAMKKYIIRIVETLMSIPPVVMGLVVYLLLSRKGIFGDFQLLFTPVAMIIAQSLLVFPIVFALTHSILGNQAKEINKNCISLGAKRKQAIILIMLECKNSILSVIATGFGRAISEVGAVMMVGGNIKGETRVMTTYIALETGQGNFNKALVIGIVLLSVSMIVNLILSGIVGKKL